MAASLLKNSLQLVRKTVTGEIALCHQQVRHHGFKRLTRERSKHEDPDPDGIRTWEQRLEGLRPALPEDRVNIGFPYTVEKLPRHKRRQFFNKRKTPELEQKSRLRQLKIPLDEVWEECELETGSSRIHSMAEHYGIFRDIFDDAFFYPSTNLHIEYEADGEKVTPSYYGNRLLPGELMKAPEVTYPASDDELFTLCMTAPDSHLQDNKKEYLHWMIGNIPGNQVDKGDLLCNYLPPFPVRGTGFHRYVFTLYKQNKSLDFTADRLSPDSISLEERTFDTFDFYSKYEDDLTPTGLAFFQSEWEPSVTQVFWNILDMEEPSFVFVQPPVYHPKQKMFPHREPFDMYLDRYRDIKDIQEEVLREKLMSTQPFQPRPAQPEYPNIYPIDKNLPEWVRTKMVYKRLRRFQWKDLDD